MRIKSVVTAVTSLSLALSVACTSFGHSEDVLPDAVQNDVVPTDVQNDQNTLDTVNDTVDAADDLGGRDVAPETVDIVETYEDVQPIECDSDLACEKAFDDLPVCWHAFCDEWLKICMVAPWQNGTACDSDNQCVKDGECLAGACVGTSVDCNDNNPCTDDSCDPDDGCMHLSNNVQCSDGNPCTTTDSCVNGSCRPGPNTCSCGGDGECAEYDDGNICNGALRCIGSKCVIDKTTIPNCQATQDYCMANVCNPESGKCEPTAVNEGSRCDDDDSCTINDVCRSGICAGDTGQCDDGNVCTTDQCTIENGCQYEFNSAPCDDGNACTTGDKCVSGTCIGTRLPECGCIIDSDCAGFEDGNPCNGRLMCSNNRCVVNPLTVVRCSDPFGRPCQRSACNPATGRCSTYSLENGRACADDNSCTYDETCQNGECVGTEIPCNDNNICTDDYCDQYGGCFHSYNTASCEDGNPCTIDDHCVNGACVSGGARDCDDGKPCTVDKCSPASGCYSTPVVESGVACDSGDLCVPTATCENGLCVGARRDCEDGDACTDNYCDSTDGTCKKRYNSSPCEDGNQCTTNDYCSNGICKSGTTVDCSDSDPCTADRCIVGTGCVNQPITGCQHCPSGLDSECESPYLCKVGICDMSSDPLGRCQWVTDPCDDGNPCTNGTCNEWNGVCTYTAVSGSCDDGNPCTLEDVCNTATMKCVGTPKPCNDGDVCTDDYCDTKDGVCKITYNTALCNDNAPCTVEDTCSLGVCSGVAKSCDDGDPCTDDYCDPITGTCHSTVNAAECEDGDPCTVGDYCELGECLTGSVKNCSDNNECTADSCRASDGFCLHDATPGITCGASNKCIVSGTCNSLGGCDATYKNCDDGKVCTTDSCNPTSGVCLHSPNTLSCDDGNACTSGDVCFNGLCSGTTITCNDGIACTADSCDTSKGCVFTPNAAACDDGNACTVDTCSPTLGCVHTALPNSPATSCDDGNPCTLSDTCYNGACVGTAKDCADTIICTKDYCNTSTGQCVNEYYVGPCDDGNPCTTNDQCNAAQICSGTTTVCNDGIACTTDYCLQGVGCVYTPMDALCDDGKVCTTNKCVAGTGCIFTPVTTPMTCDDGNLCTTGDTCNTTTGLCVGTERNCNDNNVCTSDGCTASTGQCTHSAVPGSCSDGIDCTLDDTCISGICYGTPTDSRCEDDNACTTDVCSYSGKKCVYQYSGQSTCDDHDACTENDSCVDVLCSGVLNCQLAGCSADPRCII